MLVEYIRPFMGSDTAATVATMLGIFIVALIAISLVNYAIVRLVSVGGSTGFLDHLLGLAFGAARGAFIVVLSFLLLSRIFNKEHYPDWLENAQTRPFAERGVEWMTDIFPDYLDKNSKLGDELAKFGEKSAGEADADNGKAVEGYRQRDIKDLDRLIDAQTR